MGEELPNIALPKHFMVIKELPMMSSGKIDFRTVTKIVQEVLNERQVFEPESEEIKII